MFMGVGILCGRPNLLGGLLLQVTSLFARSLIVYGVFWHKNYTDKMGWGSWTAMELRCLVGECYCLFIVFNRIETFQCCQQNIKERIKFWPPNSFITLKNFPTFAWIANLILYMFIAIWHHRIFNIQNKIL